MQACNSAAAPARMRRLRLCGLDSGGFLPCFRCGLYGHPLHEYLVAHSEDYGPGEQAYEARGDHPAQGADENYRHGRIDTPAQQSGVQISLLPAAL